ncbi:MAG: hypothetical protein PVJ34_07195 [Anaerolineae bacterium]
MERKEQMRRQAVTGILLALLLVACGDSPTARPQPTERPPAVTEGEATEPAATPVTPVAATDTPAPTPQREPTEPVPGPTPSPAPLRPSVRILGAPEVVFDWGNDRCAAGHHPDLPARAFRDSGGRVQLLAGSPSNYRMMGDDLDSLAVDCHPVLQSDGERDAAAYNYLEWMGATYTADGETIHALVHMEYYGDRASTWYALEDFGGRQGERDWRYESWSGGAYQDMGYVEAQARWQGPQELCIIGPRIAHPDTDCEPSRTWVSPVDDRVTISGRVLDFAPQGGDGVVVHIYKGSEELWSATIENGDEEGVYFNLDVEVARGDEIHFRVNARGDALYDTTYFNPKVNLGPDPCPSEDRSRCTMIALTYARSTDGGRTYVQPAAPDHLVATLPYRYQPDGGQYALWQPSNIVQHPTDGYYYALVQLDLHLSETQRDIQGTCVMRTSTPGDPQSWRAWDGEGFSLPFVNPYLQPVDDPEAQTCTPVSVNEIGALTYSLTYNDYFERFMAVGHAVHASPPGFYFSLSEDLVHWTPKQVLMAADLVQTTGGATPYLAYPSIIDPGDTSRNFERPGRRPYLYFSRFNGTQPLDIDLLKVSIEFSK